MKVGLVSLGCSKNLVDTEMCIGLFKKERFDIVNDPKEADIIVVNTCGFIESAKEEAINTLLEMSKYKENAKCKYLIAMGCLVQRYKKDLEKSMPEVDLFLSIDEYNDMWNKISDLVHAQKSESKLDYMNRIVSTGKSTAYLKIAEGCSNKCTYCAIPNIRGPYISRKIEDIIEEAKKLADDGIKELIVIAQDTTKYGIDLYGESKIAYLLDELCKIDGIKWIRFLYAYPESITDELIEVVKRNDKICKYFDIPLQHYSNSVLKMMNRHSNSKSIENLIEKLRQEIPNVVLRTTLMVGFPGETDEDFLELYEFVNRAKFEKMGAFKYSKEDGTPAAKIKSQVHYKTKEARLKKIMELEQKIAQIKLEEKIGKEYEVIIDSITTDGKTIIARSYMDIPDEDGVIFINNNGQVKIGDFVTCIITGSKGYDLIGKLK